MIAWSTVMFIIRTILTVIGLYFCHQAVVANRQRWINRYTLWFFLLSLVQQAIAWATRLLVPSNPSYAWFDAWGKYLNFFCGLGMLASYVALALLVFGCYAALRQPRDA